MDVENIAKGMAVEFWPVSELIPYAKNSKKHSQEQVELIARSIERYGWTNPCLIAEGGIVAGHGRVMAAKHLGLKRVPCIDIGYLSPEDRKAYVIMDNRSAEAGATWDLDVLKDELDDLMADGMDIELTGFTDDDYLEMFGEQEVELPSDADPDAVPEPPEEPISQPGDCWLLGPHKIYCGDATSMDDWHALMGSERADIVATDPPYGVDLGRKNRLMDGAVGGKRNANGDIANDKMSVEEFREFLAGAYEGMFAALKPGGTAYVSHSDMAGDIFRDELQKAGFKFSQGIVWKKNQIVLGMAPYQPIHEPIMVAYKPGSKRKWYGGRKQRTVIEAGEGLGIQRDEQGRWVLPIGDTVLVIDGDAKLESLEGSVIHVPKPVTSGLHPSTKPVALWEKMIANSGRAGDIVVDPFSGSGTTIIAADRLGMIARVMEMAPKYVDTAVIRWQHYTGRRAVHARTSEEFPEAPEHREAPPTEPPVDGDEDYF